MLDKNLLNKKNITIGLIVLFAILLVGMYMKRDSLKTITNKKLTQQQSDEILYKPTEIEKKAIEFQAQYAGDLIKYKESDKQIDFAYSRLGLLKAFKDCEESLKDNDCSKRFITLFKQIKDLTDKWYTIDETSYNMFTAFVGLYGIKNESLVKLITTSWIPGFDKYYEKYKLYWLEQILTLFLQDPNLNINKETCKQFVSLECNSLYQTNFAENCNKIKNKCLLN